jgi:hypothetical protein
VARVNKSGGQTGRGRPGQQSRPSARGGSLKKAAHSRTSKRAKATTPTVHFRVKELDAQQKCGVGTSVERLFRVDETADGLARAHLVFMDRRHGWYCEHGVECPAVSQAKRIGEADRQHIGRTHNGGMRA